MTATALVSSYYDAFNKQDWSRMLSYLDENIRHDINQGASEIGIGKFKDFLGVMDAHYNEKVLNLVVMASGESRAAAEFVIDGVYKKSQDGLPPAKGQKYKIPVGAFFEIKNGKITRVTNYYNLNDWIAQVNA